VWFCGVVLRGQRKKKWASARLATAKNVVKVCEAQSTLSCIVRWCVVLWCGVAWSKEKEVGFCKIGNCQEDNQGVCES